MSPRPSFNSIYMDLAKSLARRSTCSRLQVGTVITTVNHRQVLAIGYNGNASGRPNCCDRDIPGHCGCLHSEANAIINCNATRDLEKNVYITTAPCEMCAKMLVNLGGVYCVYWGAEYRSQAGLNILFEAGIGQFHL